MNRNTKWLWRHFGDLVVNTSVASVGDTVSGSYCWKQVLGLWYVCYDLYFECFINRKNVLMIYYFKHGKLLIYF